MAHVLHLLSGGDASLAPVAIRGDLAAGDDVTVALLAGADPAPSLAGARLRRVPTEWSYDRLLEEIFAADRVVTW